MSGSFAVEGGKAIITRDGRTVSTTDGTLVCLLPTALSLPARTLTFPDFSKDEGYVWTGSVRQPGTSTTTYQKAESCAVFVTAVPQEYSNKTVLADAPAGADFFIGQVKVSRTTAPQNTWMGRTLAVLPVQAQWMPIAGALSALMEADIGMARAMHIYIDDDAASATYRKLVMEAEQSVSVAIGGWDTWSVGAAGQSLFDRGIVAENVTKGIPVFLRAGSKSYGYTSPTGSFTMPTTYQKGGSSPCARGDTTVYTSVYSIDIQGRFGRRS